MVNDAGGSRGSSSSRAFAVLCAYLLLAAIYTHPLLQQSTTHIAFDAGDPLLNASILWWNATTVPFSAEWWNPPYFYPSQGVSAFTENLVGVSLVASPIYWLTGNPLAAYNLSFFLTWPLSAFAAYLLTFFLTRRHDAAFLAGLAYGFSPYRTAELGHIQMLSSYWMPLLLLGLHGFLDDRRPRWLVLFGVSWILQALCNGYFILFGAVLIALWLAYFCSTRESWRAAPAILVTWVVSSLPLVPILFEYQAIHDFYGMRRTMGEVVEFSAPAAGWTEVSQNVWLWSRFLPDFEDNLFPGVTAVLLIFGGALLALRRSPRAPAMAASRRVLVGSLAIATAAAVSTILTTLVLGPWRISLAGITVRVTDLERAVTVAIACGLTLLLLTTRIRAALARRSAFVFYVAVTLVMAVLSCGPLLRAGKAVVFDPMPYRWLMYLPGFDQLRVPTRFWMLGIMCLAVAAGLAFARHVAARRTLRPILVAIVAAGLLLDGWTRGLKMAPPPDPRAKVERRDRSEPILELPIGPEWDPAATYRSLRHRRRVVNGVSGYDPPHYWALRAGLDNHDPDMLGALSTLGSYDVIVDGAADPQGAWARYVSAAAGPPVSTDGTLALYRVAGTQAEDVTLGRALPIVAIRAHAHDPAPIVDGRADTEWMDGSQRPGQWVIVDLGSARDVGGVTHSLGEHPWDFPRRLVIEVSLDGASWAEVWNGPTGGMAFLAAVRAPRESAMRFTFAPRPARFVRLRTLAEHVNLWRIAELSVHEPS